MKAVDSQQSTVNSPKQRKGEPRTQVPKTGTWGTPPAADSPLPRPPALVGQGWFGASLTKLWPCQGGFPFPEITDESKV